MIWIDNIIEALVLRHKKPDEISKPKNNEKTVIPVLLAHEKLNNATQQTPVFLMNFPNDK